MILFHKKITVTVLFSYALLILTLLFISGCNDKSQQKAVQLETAKAQSKLHIALVMKTLTNPYYPIMEEGARRAEKDLGIKLLIKTAAQETSIQQQIGIVATLIEQKVNAIIIAPGDSIELIPILKQAQDAGIVIINLDNRLDPDYSKAVGLKNVPFISVDNEKAAYKSAKMLTDQLTQLTDVAIIEGFRGSMNSELRRAGALRAFNDSPNANLVASETANWKIDEAFQVAEKLYKSHPTVEAIFCANDMMALGVIEYLQTTGKTNVKVSGFDAINSALNAIKSGSLVATIDQQADEQGYQGVLAAYNMLKGNKQPIELIVETKVISQLSPEF